MMLVIVQKLTGFIEHLSTEGCIEGGTLASDLTKVSRAAETVLVLLYLLHRREPCGPSEKR